MGIEDALDNLDTAGTKPVKEDIKQNIRAAADEAVEALGDMDEENLLFHDTETNVAEKMNMLYVAGKIDGWKYRWIRRSDVLRRKAQGWIIDTKATAMKQDGSDANATHDMVLMRIPQEKADKINRHWVNKSKKLSKTLDFEDAGQKKMAVEYLKKRGVPARVIDSLL